MSRGIVKLIVALVFGVLGFLPVIGIVFYGLAALWTVWGVCLIGSSIASAFSRDGGKAV